MIFSVFQKNWVFGYSWSTLLWYRCYYTHRSRDALSPVCGIFKISPPLPISFQKRPPQWAKQYITRSSRPSVRGMISPRPSDSLLVHWIEVSLVYTTIWCRWSTFIERHFHLNLCFISETTLSEITDSCILLRMGRFDINLISSSVSAGDFSPMWVI